MVKNGKWPLLSDHTLTKNVIPAKFHENVESAVRAAKKSFCSYVGEIYQEK